MSGDDHLSPSLVCNPANQIVDLSLQHDMLVRVGLVEEDDRGGTRIQEGKQQEHLKRSTPRIGEVKRPVAAPRLVAQFTIFTHDVRLSGGVYGLQQLHLEQVSDLLCQSFPVFRTVTLGYFQQQIPENLTRSSLTDEQVLHTAVAPRFIALDPREWRHMNNFQIFRRCWWEILDSFPIKIFRATGSGVH